MSIDSPAQKSHSLPFVVFLVITSLMCGALVMVIEVLGSRIIGPFFGSSLFVWTSLITVTLVGLALGYTVGGILSDRRESPVYLYGIILLAGVAVLLIPVLKRPVLEVALSLGLRFGALTASALLFGPALCLLGCVSPYIVKIAALEIKNIGRTVGLFYAVSTVGSFVGTVLAGFILIAWFPVNQIFVFIGGGLIVLAALYFLFFRNKRASLLLLALPFILPAPREIRAKVLPDGTKVTKLCDVDSFYGNVKVMEYSSQNNRIRELLLDGAAQGGMHVATRMSVFGYSYYLQYIPYSLNPKGKNCLVIGLGMGAVPMWYESMGIMTDVVDINPEIFRSAEKYFGFANRGERIVEDARYFVSRSGKKYDYIILDVFAGESTPFHVLSLESLQLISRRLNPGGVLGVNLIGSLRKDSLVTASVIKTMQQVFTTVDIYPTSDPLDERGITNVEVFAYNAPPVSLDREKLQGFPFHPLTAAARKQIGSKFTLPLAAPGIILTDNYNPIDSWDLQIKEEVRRGVLMWTDKDMLL
jgi:spermidine synthase